MIDDAIIIRGLRKGDHSALKLAFDKYYDGMIITAMRFMDAEEAQDIVQDVFVKFWQLNPVFKNDYGLGSYLMRMVRNECMDIIDHNKRLKRRSDAYILLQDDRVYPGKKVDHDAIERMDFNLQVALSALSPRYKEAVNLVYFKGMRYKDAAIKMKISPNTINNMLHIALGTLRKLLKNN